MQKIFGTDGVRGVVDKDITPKLCFFIGKTLGYYLNSINKKTIIIAKDTRTTGDMLYTSLTSGLVSQGIDVVYAGIMTTPALSYLTKNCRYPMGVMLTASHNTAEYNGIKIFDCFGNKPNNKLEKQLQSIFNKSHTLQSLPYDKYGKIINKPNLKTSYINFLDSLLKGLDCDKKVCFDMSNGASNYILKKLLPKHFKNYITIGTCTKGQFVNNSCGATKIDALQQAVIDNNCDLGFAYDGDADRVVMVKDGKVLDGDDILYILAVFLKEQKLLKHNTVVGTVMSNFGLKEALNMRNIDFVRVDVGDKHIVDYIAKHNLQLGGEQAGHIIINSLSNTGDGVLVSIILLRALMYYGAYFDDITKELTKYPQLIKNVHVSQDKKQIILSNDKLRDTLKVCQARLLDEGRILIRPSGTEPLIRIMVEGKDCDLIQHIADTIAKVIDNN